LKARYGKLISQPLLCEKKQRLGIMASRKLLLLPGDGIGPEAMAEVRKIIAFLNSGLNLAFETGEGLVGGSAYDAHGQAISDADMEKALAADAVLFGAVGGPKWDSVPYEVRPEAGLLRLRKDLALYANLRPAICYPALAHSSSLKPEVIEGLDILILRELTGGVYFGEPKEIIDLGNGQKRGIDTQVYDTYEIERIADVAFELARTRRNKVTSMEKRNVMKSGVLWNQVVTARHKEKHSSVELEHMLADAGGMQLVRWPKQFDVIVTDNLFGDMLSDVAAMLTGSLGMLPSASLGAADAKTGKRKALYEPVHGSAPDIAGQGIANPIAMIASLAMCLRYSFNLIDEADRLEAAIAGVLDDGLRTADIWSEGTNKVGTTEMGDAILAKFKALSA
jgi:3-isopropylmalate dehydrogenase